MKKILAMVLSLALVATMVITGSIAYLQDSDEAVNVMTLGNVYIDQHEYERVQKEEGSNLTVTGGTFAEDPSSYIASGYVATETDGVWVVTAP